MKDYVPSYPNPDDDDRPEWEKKLRPLFSAAEDKDGEGARPSSLIPACKMPDPGLGYELMLTRELKIINEQTVRELGPLPKGGLPVQQKRKPTRPYTDFLGRPVLDVLPIIEENDEMKLRQLTAASVLTVAGTLAASGMDGMPKENGKEGHFFQSVSNSQNKPISQLALKTTSQPSDAYLYSTSNSGSPKEFSPYASVTIGDNLRCIAGVLTDKDGMNQRPYVYVASISRDDVVWGKVLDVPEGFYESRATHCIDKGSAIYVLLQSDTQSQQTLSQTVLQVVKINASNGTFEGSKDVVIPNVTGTYSAWVSKGEKNFRQANDELLITGQYRLVDTDEPFPFHISMKKW